MDVFVFSSNNLTNIWAGVGARRWAVSLKLAINKGTITKAKKLSVGAIGLLYCSGTGELTTPFLVTSLPEVDKTISDIWPEEWGLSFGIMPLGSPHKRISKLALSKELPSVTQLKVDWNKVLFVQPNFSFQPSKISTDDWAYLFGKLAT